MSIRGNKPVGRAARIIFALCLVMILIAIVAGIMAVRRQPPLPARGAAALPDQAARAGVQPGDTPAGR